MNIPFPSFMNLKTLLLLPALLFTLTMKSRAQEGGTPIKVTITKYPDHSYAAMKTDPDAHSAENTKYDATGKVMQTTVFALDDAGKAVSSLIYAPKGDDPKGTLLSKATYKYDASNRVSEVDYYTPTDQLKTRQVYQYGADGKVIKIDNYDASGKLTSSQTSPDEGAPR